MTGLPDELFQKWKHSFEEEEGEVTVYRPNEYDFPLARGREGFEITHNGKFIDFRIGRRGGIESVTGEWREEGPGRIRVSFVDKKESSRVLDIVQVEEGKLKIRESEGG